MKQRWGLDRNNVLRPTPGDPWGVEQHHWSKRKPTVEPRWAKQQTKKLRPQLTKINSFMSGPSLRWCVQLKRKAKLRSYVYSILTIYRQVLTNLKIFINYRYIIILVTKIMSYVFYQIVYEIDKNITSVKLNPYHKCFTIIRTDITTT